MQEMQKVYLSRCKLPCPNAVEKKPSCDNYMSYLWLILQNPIKKRGNTKRKLKMAPEGSSTERSTIRIGKSGPSSSQIKEISRQLDKRKTVKVKVLKTGLTNLNTEEIAKKVAEETDSKITEVRGHTFTICKNC